MKEMEIEAENRTITYNYVKIHKPATDSNLSMEALGVLVYCLSKPSKWVFYKSQLRERFGVGRDKMDSVFRELEQKGFLKCEQYREDGKFSGVKFIFTDVPSLLLDNQASPSSPLPCPPKPNTAEQPLVILNNSNNIYLNKEIQKKEFDEEQFNQWWELYDYKVDKAKAMKSWAKMTDLERSEALSSVVWYVEATTTSNAPRDPLKPFIPKRKNPSTWLNGRCWEDEAYKPKPNPYQQEIDRLEKLAKDKWAELLEWEQKGREQNTNFWDEIGALQREVKDANNLVKYLKDKWEVEKNKK